MLSGLPLVGALAAAYLAVLTLLPGILLQCVAIVKRTERPAILGPLFWHELITVTRRGIHYRLRVAYSLLLIIALFAVYLSEFRELDPIHLLVCTGGEFPRDRVARFAETYFHIYLFCQLGMLMIMTPIFAGGSITEEKDRQTLAFLQSSLLSNREIILGKMAARMVFVLGIALTGFPVLSLTFLLGGVDPILLFLAWISLVISTVNLAAYSVWIATRSTSLKEVIISAYTYELILMCVSACFCGFFVSNMRHTASPLTMLITMVNLPNGLFDPIIATQYHIVFQGTLAVVFAIMAAGNVRKMLIRQPSTLIDDVHLEEAASKSNPGHSSSSTLRQERARERPPPRLVRIPAVGDNDPFYWKELYFAGRLPTLEIDALRGCWLAFMVAALMPMMFGIVVAATSSDRPNEVLNPVFRYASLIMASLVVPIAGLRAVGTVVVERQRQTLESLFTMPVDREQILHGKLRAMSGWLGNWMLLYGMFVIVPLAVGSVPVLAVLLTFVLIGSCIPLVYTLAIWLSIRCPTMIRAAIWYITIIIGYFLVPPILAVIVRAFAHSFSGSISFLENSSMIFCIPNVVLELGTTQPIPGAKTSWNQWAFGSALMSLCSMGLSWALWRDAKKQFELEGR